MLYRKEMWLVHLTRRGSGAEQLAGLSLAAEIVSSNLQGTSRDSSLGQVETQLYLLVQTQLLSLLATQGSCPSCPLTHFPSLN